MRKIVGIVVRVLLVLVVLGAGIGGAIWLKTHGPQPKQKPVETPVALVEVTPAAPCSQQVQVVGMGTVVAAKSVVVKPEVVGRIIQQHPNLVPGGLIASGDEIARIDSSDYDAAVKQQEAAVERAKLELKIEEGRQLVAQREWKLLEKDITISKTGRELALRKPQLKNAKTALAAAESALTLAELNVTRTRILARFNALVQEEAVDMGQVIGRDTRLATLVGTDQFWVKVSIPVDRLPWIALPRADGTGGATATVIHEAGPQTVVKRQGRVVRLLGELDPVGRMARVLVAVDDPLGLEASGGCKPAVNARQPGADAPGSPASRSPSVRRLPLLLGTYVRVAIQGARVNDVYVVPRTALREGAQVWVMNAQDRLEMRQVDVFWRRQDDVLVRNSIKPGERIVISRLASPLPGMKLQVRGAASPATSRPTRAAASRSVADLPRSRRAGGVSPLADPARQTTSQPSQGPDGPRSPRKAGASTSP